MRGAWICGLVALWGCKAEIGGGVTEVPTDGSDMPEPDGAPPPDAPRAWSAPRLVPGANTTIDEDDGTLSHSGLEMVFALEDANDGGRKHLYYVRRDTPTSTTWTAPVRLGFFLANTTDQTPRFAADDLTLYFASNRPGTTGGLDIWSTTRANTTSTTWSMPALVAGVNSAATDKWFMPCTGNRYLLISSRSPSTTEDVYEGTLGGGAPARVAELSSDGGETGAFVTADCLTAHFASTRSGTNAIYTATRASAGGTWGAPTAIADFAALGGAQEDPWISPDGNTFVLSSNATGSKDMYISTR